MNIYILQIILTLTIGLSLTAAAIILVYKIEKKDKLRRKQELKDVNRNLITSTQNNISEILKLHPELPPTAKIKGDNAKVPINFGRIYDTNIDFTFPIETPVQTSYNSDSGVTTYLSTAATDARLTISGTIQDYTIKVDSTNEKLRYNSIDNKIIDLIQSEQNA